MTDPVAVVKADVAAVETKVVTFWDKQVAWVKANWAHLATWAYLVYQSGACSVLAKLVAKL